MSCITKPPQGSIGSLPGIRKDAAQQTADLRVALAVRGPKCCARPGSIMLVLERMAAISRWRMSAAGVSKPAGWTAAEREKRLAKSKRQAAGGLMERDLSTEKEQNGKEVASSHERPTPQFAFPGGLEKNNHSRGRRLETAKQQPPTSGGLLERQEVKGKTADLVRWLSPPRKRLVAKSRTAGRAALGNKEEESPRALGSQRERAETGTDGPSTSGRKESIEGRGSRSAGRYADAVLGATSSALDLEPSDESEEEAGPLPVGETISYESLKSAEVDSAIRIEKLLLRDGLQSLQARALALYVVKNEIPGGYDAIKQRVAFLLSLKGLKFKQAIALLLAQKRTLKRPVEELESNVNYLLTAGVPADQLGYVVRRSPQILLTSVQARLEPSVRCLRGLGLDVGKMVVKNPRVVSYDLEGRAREVIGFLKSIGLSQDDVQVLLEKDATLLTMTNETLEKKVEFLFRKSASVEAALDLIKSSPLALYADVEQAIEQVEMLFATFGLEVGDTFELLIKWPALMSMTKRPMLEKVEFVRKELGWSMEDVLEYPLFLSFSLEKKLRPRCRKVLEEGIVIAKPNEAGGLKLHTMLVCSDENFEHYLSEIWPNKYRRTM